MNVSSYFGKSLGIGPLGIALLVMQLAAVAVPAAHARVSAGGWETLGPAYSTQGNRGCLVGELSSLVAAPDGFIYLGGRSVSRCGDVEAGNVFGYDPAADQFFSLAGGVTGGSLTQYFIDTMVWHDGSLYVGGTFQEIGGVSVPAGVARWDGVQWHAVGGAMAGHHARIHSLVVHDGSLYASGNFYNSPDHGVGPYPCRIARWDGSEWQKVVSCGESGSYYFFGTPRTLVSTQQGLIAAHYFWLGNSFGRCSSPVKGISLMASTAYPAPQSGMPAYGGLTFAYPGATTYSASFAPTANGMYIGGSASNIEHLPTTDNPCAYNEEVGPIVWWDWATQTYTPVGAGGADTLLNISGSRGSVATVLLHDSILYVGGQFKYAEGRVVNNIARWDGARWSGLGTGWGLKSVCGRNAGVTPTYTVRALAVAGDYLYVAGNFLTANSAGSWSGDDQIRATGIARVRLDSAAGDALFSDQYCADEPEE